MTREEARNLLNNSKPKGNNAYSIMLNEALDMAIKALEQEPCEDAIPRQAVKEQMLKYGFYAPDMTVTEFVEDFRRLEWREIGGNSGR